MPGLIVVRTNSQITADDQAAHRARIAQAAQVAPPMSGLAAYVEQCWQEARTAKQPVETKMLRALRQRSGEYEPEKLAAIQRTGGSEIYMMITETKCRGAESWLRDILLDESMVPFALKATPNAEMPPDFEQRVTASLAKSVIEVVQSGTPIEPGVMEMMQEQLRDDVHATVQADAEDRAHRMQRLIEDQFVQGGLLAAFDEFISDLATYPLAVLKGPEVRRKRALKWAKQPDGSFAPQAQETLAPTFRRVDPFRFYPEPGITRLSDGYCIEHHKLSEGELAELIGVPGYDEFAIRELLAEGSSGAIFGTTGTQKSSLENKYHTSNTRRFDALEFWGTVSGRLLREWGLTDEEVPDEAQMYDACVWKVGRWVIKATLNYDPLGDKPYRCATFVRKPGSFWGSSLPELIEDVTAMANAAARALANNMGIASGPQVEINIDRLPQGEKITSIYPWKIWQTTSDPMGSQQPAVRFSQPDDRSGSLLAVYHQFSRMADEQSGIPAFVYGGGVAAGAGRTASGLSMLMGSAGKGIRQVIMGLDQDIIAPLVTAQYVWNMQYVDDPSVKGDCQVVPRGAIALANRDQMNVRRVEFLQATANPIDSQIVGVQGRAAILREVAKGLAMPVDDIVPSNEKLEIIEEMQRRQAAMQPPQPPEAQQAAMATAPDGGVAGGQEGNVVSSHLTGRSA